MSKQPKLFLPAPDGTGNRIEITHNGSMVIVGANGSGESRPRAWKRADKAQYEAKRTGRYKVVVETA